MADSIYNIGLHDDDDMQLAGLSTHEIELYNRYLRSCDEVNEQRESDFKFRDQLQKKI